MKQRVRVGGCLWALCISAAGCASAVVPAAPDEALTDAATAADAPQDGPADASPDALRRVLPDASVPADAPATVNPGPPRVCADCHEPDSFAQVAIGMSHTCVRTRRGTVQCWGDDSLGQLGDDRAAFTTSTHAPPRLVPGLTGVTQLAAGGHHTCARRGDGTVWCWGANNEGQLGTGLVSPMIQHPVEVRPLRDVAEVTAGDMYSCARTNAGVVWCWGGNRNGQLGDGSFTRAARPVPVRGLPPAVQLSSRKDFACARLASGQVACWGARDFGQLGNGLDFASTGRPYAALVPGVSNTTEIAVSDTAAYVVRADGSAMVWGEADEIGDLFVGPTEVGSLHGATRFAIGWDDCGCALWPDGVARCFGDNNEGELGDGTTTSHHTPVPIAMLRSVVNIAMGWGRACAVRADDTVWCWGTGIGPSPVQVPLVP